MKIRHNFSFWIKLIILLVVNIFFIVFICKVASSLNSLDSLAIVILFAFIIFNIDVLAFIFSRTKHYGLMVNNAYYYCGKNILDGATLIKKRKTKKSYKKYGAGSEEWIFVNKTNKDDLLFGVIDVENGDRIVVFYRIVAQYDFINIDNELNEVNVTSKYPLESPFEYYKLQKLDGNKYGFNRFYHIFHFYEERISKLSPKAELLEDKRMMFDECESEKEAVTILKKMVKNPIILD